MPSGKEPSMKTYIYMTLYGLNRLYLGIYLYVYTYMQVITINEIETMSLNVSREGYMGRFLERKVK